MTLVRILDLLDTEVSGKLADLRSRDDQGELLYDFTEKEGPRLRKMKSVEIRKQSVKHAGPKEPWLYWTWERDTTNMSDCGYSGVALSSDRASLYHILIEDAEAIH